MYPFSLKCQNNVFKRRNSGGYLDTVQIKIKTCFDYSALDNRGISDLGTIRTGDLKKKSLTWGSTTFKMRYTELLGRGGLHTGMCQVLLILS